MKNNKEFIKLIIFDIDISPFQQYPMTYKGVVSQQKDTLPKENCMNKKFIAFTLVLLIAMGGLFAALPSYTVATALLKGTIGDIFKHGFLIGDATEYDSDVTLTGNAFETPPEIKYGFTAKHGSAFKSQLSVTAFIKTGATVDIATVTITVPGSDAVVSTWVDASTPIDILEYKGTDLNKTVTKDAMITITPASTEGKESGQYTSTVTVSLTTTS